MTTKYLKDQYCPRILLVLDDKEVRFNTLFKLLHELGLKLSKPTLATHLKHLVDRGFVIREQKGKQHVTYRFNDAIPEYIPEMEKSKTKWTKWFQVEKEAFFDLSIEQQLRHVVRLMAIRNMRQLYLKIEHRGDYEKGLHLLMLYNPRLSYRHYENWVMERCEKDNEYRKKISPKIEEMIESIME